MENFKSLRCLAACTAVLALAGCQGRTAVVAPPASTLGIASATDNPSWTNAPNAHGRNPNGLSKGVGNGQGNLPPSPSPSASQSPAPSPSSSGSPSPGPSSGPSVAPSASSTPGSSPPPTPAPGSLSFNPVAADFPISTAVNAQELPQIAYNSRDNDYLVVWSDARNGNTNYDIYGQLVSPTGSLIGANFPISTAPGNQGLNQGSLSVAYNAATGAFLVAWDDDRNGSSNYDIYGQQVSASGSLVGSEISLATASNNQQYPALAYNSQSGGYLLVYQDNSTVTCNPYSCFNNYGVFAQPLGSNGVPQGAPVTLQLGTNNNTNPSVVYDAATNEYFVAWSNAQIYGQRVSASGSPAGSNIIIDPGYLYRRDFPHAAYNARDNEYFVIWRAFDASLANGQTDHIYGQRLDAAGNLLATTPYIIEANIYQPYVTSLAYSSGGDGYAVVWNDYSITTASLYAQLVNHDGSLNSGKATFTTATGYGADVVYNPAANQYLVAWQDDRNRLTGTSADWDIYGQLFH